MQSTPFKLPDTRRKRCACCCCWICRCAQIMHVHCNLCLSARAGWCTNRSHGSLHIIQALQQACGIHAPMLNQCNPPAGQPCRALSGSLPARATCCCQAPASLRQETKLWPRPKHGRGAFGAPTPFMKAKQVFGVWAVATLHAWLHALPWLTCQVSLSPPSAVPDSCNATRPQVVGTLDGVASPEDCCRACHASSARCTVRSCILFHGTLMAGPGGLEEGRLRGARRGCSSCCHSRIWVAGKLAALLTRLHADNSKTMPCPGSSSCCAAGVELVRPCGSCQGHLLLSGQCAHSGGSGAQCLAM